MGNLFRLNIIISYTTILKYMASNEIIANKRLLFILIKNIDFVV